MHRPMHSPHDPDRPRPTLACDPAEDKARQEFKAESDVNILLKRYGAHVPQQAPAYGRQNFDFDRLTAITAVRQFERSFARLPGHILAKYPTPEALMAAVESGELASLDSDKASEPVSTPEGTSTPPAAS